MISEIKQKWVDALRSGRYNQTKHRLADADGYCCLGVLCEIAVNEGVAEKFHDGEFGIKYGPRIVTPEEYDINHPQFDNATLPKVVCEWAGLVNDNPEIAFEVEFVTLSELNDDWGYDFNAIADVIEEQL